MPRRDSPLRLLLSARLLTYQSTGILHSVRYARKGGFPSKVLLGMSMIDQILQRYVGRSPYELMARVGYTRVEVSDSVLDLLYHTLEASSHPRRNFTTRTEHGDLPSFVWFDAGMCFLVARNEGVAAALFVADDCDYEAILSQELWKDRTTGITLTATPSRRSQYHGPVKASSANYRLLPLKASSDHVGSPTPQDILDDLDEDARSILMVGPTGSGKSTLARKVAQLSDGGRTLHITGYALKRSSIEDVLDLARFIRPSTLVLDDIPLSSAQERDLYVLFEDVRDKVPLLIATFMEDDPAKARFYWPGMRPGRIDHLVVLGYPDADKRMAVLGHYLNRYRARIRTPSEELIEATAGLTPAYLARLARRVSRGGDWAAYLEQLRLQAPRLEDEE